MVEFFESPEGGRAAFDIETARTLHPDDSPYDQTKVDYFLGKYLELRGKEDLAIELWQQCMVSNEFVHNRTLACGELIRRGHEAIAPADRPTTEKPKESRFKTSMSVSGVELSGRRAGGSGGTG